MFFTWRSQGDKGKSVFDDDDKEPANTNEKTVMA